MKGNELRQAYLQFFESKGHLKLDTFSLIPENDPSLLLIGAGMAPLKPFFTGKLVPPCHRITTSQKCMRTGDLENVGRTARHHTFFETYEPGPSHSGIYIGNGKFISATSSRGVAVADLDTGYWGERYIGAKRVI